MFSPKNCSLEKNVGESGATFDWDPGNPLLGVCDAGDNPGIDPDGVDAGVGVLNV